MSTSLFTLTCRHFLFSIKSLLAGTSIKILKLLESGHALVSSIKRFLIGRPLKSTELGEQKLNKTKALAIFSSDALSSVAYGPEQILIVLNTVGAAAFGIPFRLLLEY